MGSREIRIAFRGRLFARRREFYFATCIRRGALLGRGRLDDLTDLRWNNYIGRIQLSARHLMFWRVRVVLIDDPDIVLKREGSLTTASIICAIGPNSRAAHRATTKGLGSLS